MNIKDMHVRELTLEEHKKCTLEILKEVASFCDNNGLQYFIAYGTLIGALRHKGFIPWDDDIDIQMPRPDYECFAAAFNAAPHEKNYKAFAPEDPDAFHPFIKVCDLDTVKIEYGINYANHNYLGVDIDVFPLDGMYTEEEKSKDAFQRKHKVFRRYALLRGKFFCGDLHWNITGLLKFGKRALSAAARCGMKLLPVKKWEKENLLAEMRVLALEVPFDTAEMVGVDCVVYSYYRDRHPKADFESTCEVQFEDTFFHAPIGYDAVLRRQYGDYMQLPPEEKRVTHHENKVYAILKEE